MINEDVKGLFKYITWRRVYEHREQCRGPREGAWVLYVRNKETDEARMERERRR